jgi:phosphoglycerate dehydrogenase-like enzyme
VKVAYLLTVPEFATRFGAELDTVCRDTHLQLEPVTLPVEVAQRLTPAILEQIEVACCTRDFDADPVFTRRFLGSALHAPNLRWMHLPNAGVDHPVFARLREHGVRLTTSSGAAAEPIAQTAIAGLLALARGFPHWLVAQRRHEWAPLPAEMMPRDLRGQTMVVIGIGAIGNEIARLAQALGLYVIGVQRRPKSQQHRVDEMHPPTRLGELLPRADWLVVACPLTDETRRLIDAAALARLPVGARVINVARGQIIEEAAMIDALRSGRLAGAYLDVFETEPLPADSALWELPNVLLSPHDSACSDGNAERVSRLFLSNLGRWARGEPLENEVTER